MGRRQQNKIKYAISFAAQTLKKTIDSRWQRVIERVEKLLFR